jgi:hypothetical protein
MDSKGGIVQLMISVIAENLDSLGALNRLMRTNKHLSIESSTTCTISSVVQNMDGMDRKALWKLFVLPGKVPRRHEVINSNVSGVYSNVFRMSLPNPSNEQFFSPVDAFKSAMIIHRTTNLMNRESLIRKKGSTSMKLVWALKKKALQDLVDARGCEIKKIHESLGIEDDQLEFRHISHTENTYIQSDCITELNRTYRDYKFIAQDKAGILHHPDNTFRMVAVKEYQYRENLNNDERLYILKKNIAYKHFLYNYTNYLDIIEKHQITTEMVQWLFPPPSVWPWVDGSRRVEVEYNDKTNEEDYGKFRSRVDPLYGRYFDE